MNRNSVSALERVHMQSLCALAAAGFTETGTHDDATLFLVAEELGLGAEAGEELFRRA